MFSNIQLSQYRNSLFSSIDSRAKLLFVLLIYFFIFQVRTPDAYSFDEAPKNILIHLILFVFIFLCLLISNVKLSEIYIILKRLKIFILLIVLFNCIRYFKFVYNLGDTKEASHFIQLSFLISLIYSIKLIIMMMVSEWLLATTPIECFLGAFKWNSNPHKKNNKDTLSLKKLFIYTLSFLPFYLDKVESIFVDIKNNSKNSDKRKGRCKEAFDNLISLIKSISDAPLINDNIVENIEKNCDASETLKFKWCDVVFLIFVLFFTLLWEYLLITL